MVEHRIRADQAFDGAAHHRQVEEASHGALLRIDCRQRRAWRGLGDGGLGHQGAVGGQHVSAGLRRVADLGHELPVDLVGHDAVKAQEAAGDKTRHVEGAQKGQVAHAPVSTICSKKNSYLR